MRVGALSSASVSSAARRAAGRIPPCRTQSRSTRGESRATRRSRWSRRAVRRPVSTLGREEAVEVAVAGGVVGGAVLPYAPDDAQPGATEDADRVRVVVAAGEGALVDVFGPGVVFA